MRTRSSSEIEGLLWREWKAVIKVAFTTSFADDEWRQKLVGFVMDVKTKPVLESSGEVCRVHGQTVWVDLPVFGAAMREAWDVGTASDASDKDAQDRWVNINAFTSDLVETVAAAHKTDPDFSLYGIWTIRTSLEEDSKEEGKPDVTALKAAAVWFIHASNTLLDFCKQGKQFQGKVAQAGSLYRGEFNGFSTERWQAWVVRLKKLAEADNPDEEAKQLVQEALKAAEQAQK
ncbi:hypothetical protein K431DRAFT_216314 [Polychaeton citri CBS 116435]|uniref:Uncharacterized protein n=1 Tax=Polychaeton citri CBS 116435 TaxID=1314669 RepID=A0A9P4QHZ6_9PEZI|nr:hypothetical protein K431DRAFT_216314 [Polychaeton citri CBS 116435]